MPLLNDQPTVATEEHLRRPWGGKSPGERFRCHLCGHKFQIGDVFRLVHSPKYTSFIVCAKCDNESVVSEWIRLNDWLRMRCWWAFDNQ